MLVIFRKIFLKIKKKGGGGSRIELPWLRLRRIQTRMLALGLSDPYIDLQRQQ